MPEFRSLGDRSLRPPTSADLVRLAVLRDAGVAEIYLEPENAPSGFWENLVQAPTYLLVREGGIWSTWATELRWANGWQEFSVHPEDTYRDLIRTGIFEFADGERGSVGVAGRLAAVEHLLDELDQDTAAELADLINDRARFHRVGVRVEGRRFVPVTSEHMHTEVVQSTLLLLAHERFASVDELYRKAFDRALSEDPSGAVTAATSAVGFADVIFDNRIPFGIDDVAQYPLFTKELIALMRELIPREQQDAVATSVIARARRV